MASGTADLQRDLGGAIMQSVFGALLTAGYAAAAGAAIAASDKHITDSTQAQLTKSFAGAEDVAEQHPQYADAIISGAKTAFLQGDQWAYTGRPRRGDRRRRRSCSSCSRSATKSGACSRRTTPRTPPAPDVR